MEIINDKIGNKTVLCYEKDKNWVRERERKRERESVLKYNWPLSWCILYPLYHSLSK